MRLRGLGRPRFLSTAHSSCSSLVSLLIFLAFLLLARGQAVGVAAIFLITTAVVPLLATESMSVAYGFIYSLIAGSVLAVLLTFAAHAFFPMRVQAEPVSALAQEERAQSPSRSPIPRC